MICESSQHSAEPLKLGHRTAHNMTQQTPISFHFKEPEPRWGEEEEDLNDDEITQED